MKPTSIFEEQTFVVNGNHCCYSLREWNPRTNPAMRFFAPEYLADRCFCVLNILQVLHSARTSYLTSQITKFDFQFYLRKTFKFLEGDAGTNTTNCGLSLEKILNFVKAKVDWLSGDIRDSNMHVWQPYLEGTFPFANLEWNLFKELCTRWEAVV